MTNLRKVEVFKGGGWSEIKFEELEVGDKYRMFEPDGSPVVVIGDGGKYEGATEWVVLEGPYRRSKDGVWTVDCECIEPRKWE